MRDDAAGSATQKLAKESPRGRVVGRQRIGRQTRRQLDLQLLDLLHKLPP